MKLIFTEAEFDKICSIFSKLMAQRKKLPDNEWKKDTNKLVKSIYVKFSEHTEPSDTGHELHLDRKQLRLIQEVILNTNQILIEKVIPEYEKRGNLDEYKDRVTQLIALSNGILDKIGKAL